MSRSARLSSLLAILVVAACGASAKQTPKPQEPEPTAAKPTALVEGGTVVVLPIASEQYPRVAAVLDRSMKSARLHGMTVRVSSVPLDTIQLQIECTDDTNACFAKVASTVSASALLFATVDAAGATIKAEVRLVSDDGSTVKGAGATYKTEDEAIGKVAELVDSALEGIKE